MVAVGERIILAKMPGYVVATSLETTDSSTFTSETQIGSITADLIQGVRYWVRCKPKLRSTVAGDQIRTTLYEDSSSGTLLCSDDKINASTSGSRPMLFDLESLYIATTTASKTFVVTAHRVSGSGNVLRDVVSTAPQIFYIQVAD